MSNPGANMITGNGTANEIDWVVDAGVQRTDGLTSFANGAPALYAYNALTMQPLWSSAYQELDMGGKYNTIAAARGDVFVGTDRIQAFGLTDDTIVDDAVAGHGDDQFNYVGVGLGAPHRRRATMGTFDGTVSTDNVQGDFATLTFTGSQIKVYANEIERLRHRHVLRRRRQHADGLADPRQQLAQRPGRRRRPGLHAVGPRRPGPHARRSSTTPPATRSRSTAWRSRPPPAASRSSASR